MPTMLLLHPLGFSDLPMALCRSYIMASDVIEFFCYKLINTTQYIPGKSKKSRVLETAIPNSLLSKFNENYHKIRLKKNQSTSVKITSIIG